MRQQSKKDISGRDKKISALLDEMGRGPKSGRQESSRANTQQPPCGNQKLKIRQKKVIDRERINKATDDAFRTFFGKEYEKLRFNDN